MSVCFFSCDVVGRSAAFGPEFGFGFLPVFMIQAMRATLADPDVIRTGGDLVECWGNRCGLGCSCLGSDLFGCGLLGNFLGRLLLGGSFFFTAFFLTGASALGTGLLAVSVTFRVAFFLVAFFFAAFLAILELPFVFVPGLCLSHPCIPGQ